MERDHDPREENRRDRGAESSEAIFWRSSLEIWTCQRELKQGAGRGVTRCVDPRPEFWPQSAVFRAVPREDLELAIGSKRSLSKDVEHLRSHGLVDTQPYMTGRDRCHARDLDAIAGIHLLESRCR